MAAVTGIEADGIEAVAEATEIETEAHARNPRLRPVRPPRKKRTKRPRRVSARAANQSPNVYAMD